MHFTFCNSNRDFLSLKYWKIHLNISKITWNLKSKFSYKNIHNVSFKSDFDNKFGEMLESTCQIQM